MLTAAWVAAGLEPLDTSAVFNSARPQASGALQPDRPSPATSDRSRTSSGRQHLAAAKAVELMADAAERAANRTSPRSSAVPPTYGAAGTKATGVRGTWWAAHSDTGGCQMPKTDYRITDAIAVGDIAELMHLETKRNPDNRICGLVYQLQCRTGTMGAGAMGTAVEAVVVSSCDIGEASCGLDMIEKTWRKATNGANPGVTKCTVERTHSDPLEATGVQCFVRPGVGKNNDWYTSVGLFNTAGKLAKSALMDGTACTPNGISSYWDCDVPSRLTDDSVFEVTFQNGEKETMSYRACEAPDGVQIFE